MCYSTKKKIADCVRQLMKRKEISKITIGDIMEATGMSRQSFYYHFKDIYDLVEWSCMEDATRALQGKKTYDTWHEGLKQIFEAVLENKPFIMNTYHALSREQIENYLFMLTHNLLMGVVEEKSKGLDITEGEKSFIADFYKYGFVGVMLDWIGKGMKEDYTEITDRMSATLDGSITNSIQNFANKNLTTFRI